MRFLSELVCYLNAQRSLKNAMWIFSLSQRNKEFIVFAPGFANCAAKTEKNRTLKIIALFRKRPLRSKHALKPLASEEPTATSDFVLGSPRRAVILLRQTSSSKY